MRFGVQTPRIVVVGGDDPQGVISLVGAMKACPGCALVVTTDADDVVARMASTSSLKTVAVQSSARLESDRVYVVPSSAHAVFQDGELVVTEPARGGRIDQLLRTLGDAQSRDAIAVILGGTGTDGVLGIKRIKEYGGIVFVEEPPAGAFGEMGRAAIDTGLVDEVVSREALPQRLASATKDSADEELDRRGSDDAADTLRDILTLVRVRSGHDFNSYKRATLYRRVARRMHVCQTGSIIEYHRFLRDHPAELSHLLRDFLISVTNFFRDPDAFDALVLQVIPRLFADRGQNDPVRVWVAGCASGEEAYSMGMLLLEHAGRIKEPPGIQIFATDIDEDSLAIARSGRYPDTITADVSPERLERFFVREGTTYRVSQELRELVLFSPHNLLRDPPFSRLDLVSCRNLMIYLNRDAQARVLGIMHFGLRPERFLFLGSSESAENSALFAVLDAKYRIYSRRLGATTIAGESIVTTVWHPPATMPTPPASVERMPSVGEMHHRLVERYAPPSILVNGELDVIHISEHAGRFLEMAGGEPTRHVLRLIITPLRLDLRTAIYAARQSHGTELRRVSFAEGTKQRLIEMRVRSIDVPEMGPHAVLISLDELDTSEPQPATVVTTETMIEPVVRELEDELHRTRDQLRTTIEQYETSLEELKASNEELQAINEELRSASEELETSKEELQSVNEELTTLNHELKLKVDEISHANSDLQNLMTSTDIGVLFLDRTLYIKRFTPRALDLFNIIPSDIGRPLAHVTHKLAEATDLSELAQTVLQNLRPIDREMTNREGRRYMMRMLPYRSLEDRIEGVVITFVDVTDLREAVAGRLRSEAALAESESRLVLALRGAPVLALTVDNAETITWGFVLGREVSPGPIKNHQLFEPEDAKRFATACRQVMKTGAMQQVELEIWILDEARTYDVRIDPTGSDVTAVGFDITPSKNAARTMHDADRRKDEFLATLSHELRNPLAPLKVALDVARMAKDDPEKVAKSHAIMERQLAKITELVDDLLDLSRIAQGKIELARVPVSPSVLVEAALEATRPLVLEQRHQVSVSLPPTSTQVLGDVRRLTQVLTNVLTNAAKYTPPGGHIEIVVRESTDRKRVVFTINDDGTGIAPDLLPHIFDIFVQSRDEGGRARGGLGIGLNLVRRLVEAHGGTVAAKSDGENHGASFVLELPSVPA
jgi:two-component system CheB/CheR fusion protein